MKILCKIEMAKALAQGGNNFCLKDTSSSLLILGIISLFRFVYKSEGSNRSGFDKAALNILD